MNQKHQKFIDYVHTSYASANGPNEHLRFFEDYLRRQDDDLLLTVYMRVFVNGKPYSEIAEYLQTDTCRISEICDRIVMDYANESVMY